MSLNNILSNGEIQLLQGTGSPNGVVPAAIGSLYVDMSTGNWWSETAGPTGTSWTQFGAGGVSYTNTTGKPAPALGGIAVGSTFSGVSMQAMWDMLLYPYQAPAFSSFTSVMFGSYEVGQSLASGLQTVNYVVSNPSNIKSPQPPNVGIASTNIAGATADPAFVLNSSGSFQVDIPSGFYLGSPGSRTISLQGTNSQNATFSTSGSMNWYYKRYWGTATTFGTLTDPQILAANGAGVGSGSELSTSRVQTRNGIDGGGNYIFFAWPTSFGTPSFVINGLPNTAWTLVRSSVFVNGSGYTLPIDVWMSNTPQFSPITSFQIN